MEIYQPAEDSYFFVDFLKDYFSKQTKMQKQAIKYLDMGAGSGILAETAEQSGIQKQNILAIDINPEAVKLLKQKKFKAIMSNLFDKVPKNKKFDLITFNAPYLPNHKYDNQKDTSGGKKGDEVALKFLKQAKQHLKRQGKIFLLISSSTPHNKLKKLKLKFLKTKKLFFEELYILEAK